MSAGDGVAVARDPWDTVRLGFARTAARRMLLRQGRPVASDAFDELTAAVACRVSELAATGMLPSRKMYRMAAQECCRSLWSRAKGLREDTLTDEVDELDDGDNVGELVALSLVQAQRLYADLPAEHRGIFTAYLAGDGATEIAADTGHSRATVDMRLTVMLAHLRDGTTPRYRHTDRRQGAHLADALTCEDCGDALAVPHQRGGIPVRCAPCAKNRRKAKDAARHAARVKA